MQMYPTKLYVRGRPDLTLPGLKSCLEQERITVPPFVGGFVTVMVGAMEDLDRYEVRLVVDTRAEVSCISRRYLQEIGWPVTSE
jgi:hypothetical protein